MSSPIVTPPAPETLQIPNDPVMDQLYGTPAVEKNQGKPPISRSYQFADEFTPPPAPPSLETAPTPITAPPAPVPAPAPTPPVQTAPEAPVTPPAPTVEAPKEFTATVDLGDGSGPQIFKADTQQGVIDKLVEAQKNATLRIRQLKEKAKAKPDTSTAPEPLTFQPRTLNEAELTEINELAKTNFAAAWQKFYEATTGTKPDAVARAVYEAQQMEQKDKAQRAEAEFIADHIEDFDCSPESGNKMYSFLAGCTRPVTDGGFNCKRCGKIHDLPMQTTRQNLDYAFETLTEQGAVFMKKAIEQPPAPVVPTPTPVVVPPAPPVPVTVQAPPQVPAPPVPTAPPPPVMLSDRSGQRPPQQEPDGGVDVTGLATMPLHEMKARIGKLMKQGSAASR